jgi:A/G-specific adenine glycosylase
MREFNTEMTKFFSDRLLEWYQRHKRDLPWRRSRDPYHIWISEVMLQQTRVETVIPYYNKFIEQFPTVEALADAKEEDVLKAWEGLGYYSRARNLQSAVREVKESYGGVVPDSKEAFGSLKGVGPYTAGAVLSIAYNLPEPAVDGNVMRVLSRFFLLRDDIAKPATRAGLEKLARALIPEGEAGSFNQALMELGATVCTPKSPRCLTCPVMEHCASRLEGVQHELPVKTKAKRPKLERRAAALIEGTGAEAGKVLIRQRAKKGLLAGMWELPHAEAPEEAWQLDSERNLPGDKPGTFVQDWLREKVMEEIGIAVEPLGCVMEAEHTFSHIQWQMRVYRCAFAGYGTSASGNGLQAREGRMRWASRQDLEELAFPNLFLRILNQHFGRA